MKKVLLSLSLLTASLFAANAQQIIIWNASDATSVMAKAAYDFAGSGLTVDTAASAPFIINATGSTTGYYVGGWGNGSFSGPATGLPWGITATDLTTYKLFIDIKSTGTGSKVKIQLGSTASTDSYGIILDLTSGATLTNFVQKGIPLSTFSKIGDASTNFDPDGTNFMTAAIAAGLYKIEFAVNAAGATGSVDLSLKNIFFSTSSTLGTTAAAANIGSSVLFPNPAASEAVFANLTLHTPANVQMIVTDMVGKQIASTNFGTVSSINGVEVFNTSGLAKGSYLVTYVLDGAPAKSQLVVVR